MERKLATLVRREFKSAMAAQWPQFEPLSFDRAAHGELLFRWKPDTKVWFFLYLAMTNFNEFFVELLWNTKDDCPWDCFPDLAEQDPSRVDPNRCRMMVPSGEGHRNKQWKVGSNPAYVPAVVVPTALAEFRAWALPIIEKVLRRLEKGERPRRGGTLVD